MNTETNEEILELVLNHSNEELTSFLRDDTDLKEAITEMEDELTEDAEAWYDSDN